MIKDFIISESIENGTNVVSFDVPLFIRLLELSREDLKDDQSIHFITAKIIGLSKDKEFLTMEDYKDILTAIRQ